MKKKIYVTAIILTLTLILCFSVGCSLFTNDNEPQKYFVEIGQVEDSRVASIVANNTLDSCVRISAFYPSASETSKSSGFFVTSDGYIVTNRHCVVRFPNGEDLPSQEGEIPINVKYTVTDTKGDSYGAKLVAYSKTADVALIKIVPNVLDTIIGSTTEFSPMIFDVDSKPYYGDRLYTIGNPEDLGFILTELMVASPGIKLSSKNDYYTIMLDGNINHGNSGGALIDTHSHVVGLIFARVEGASNEHDSNNATSSAANNNTTSSPTYGLGCAIPAEVVTTFLDDCKIQYSKYTPTQSDNTQE